MSLNLSSRNDALFQSVGRKVVQALFAPRDELQSGSHWFIPANVEHVSACLPGVECVMAIHQHGAFDFIAAENE